MNIGSLIPPVIIALVVIFALIKRIPIFQSFVNGAQEGLECSISTAAPLVALITAVAMLKASGAMDMLINFVSPLTSLTGFPAQCVPLAIMKPISGSASTALLTDIFKNFGSDNLISKLAAVIAGSTETLFYTMAIYFGTIKVKNTRHTIACALIADITAIICAYFMLFKINKIF
ncbi:MAG: spore maturation protein [Oscillospiraceae bacterium]|jgi:spore maturation protein B|nr:spore maturation protein [Oscillospiraceae bacterium]